MHCRDPPRSRRAVGFPGGAVEAGLGVRSPREPTKAARSAAGARSPACAPSSRRRAQMRTRPLRAGRRAGGDRQDAPAGRLQTLAARRRARSVFEGRCRPTDHRPYGSLVELSGPGGRRQRLGPRAGPRRPPSARCRSSPACRDPGTCRSAARADDLRLHFFEAVRRAVRGADGQHVRRCCMLHDLHRADVATLWR
jgi:hypothetical protein